MPLTLIDSSLPPMLAKVREAAHREGYMTRVQNAHGQTVLYVIPPGVTRVVAEASYRVVMEHQHLYWFPPRAPGLPPGIRGIPNRIMARAGIVEEARPEDIQGGETA